MPETLFVIFIFASIAGLALSTFLVLMCISDTENVTLSIIVFAFVTATAIVGFSGLQSSRDYYYKLGQIDANNGNMRYELKINPDSTRTWELKK